MEDDERIRTAVIRMLRDRGHAVSSAGTALSGLQAAVAERPDLVVLDLGLPDLDGGGLLRASAPGRTEVTLELGPPPA